MRIRNAQTSQYKGSDQFSWREVRIEFCDPKLYLRLVINMAFFQCYSDYSSGAIQFCQDILLYGFSTFLPSILKASGYGTLASNYLTIPVYVFGALMFYAAAFASDRFLIRSPVISFQCELVLPLIDTTVRLGCQSLWYSRLHLAFDRDKKWSEILCDVPCCCGGVQRTWHESHMAQCQCCTPLSTSDSNWLPADTW